MSLSNNGDRTSAASALADSAKGQEQKNSWTSKRTRSDEVKLGLNWEKANRLALSAACELQMSNGDSAAGTLYREQSGAKNRYLFVSTHRRLLVKSPDDLSNAQLLIHVRPESCEYIPLSRDKVCSVWNTRPHGEHTGNTVVELSDETARMCLRKRAKFLRIGKARVGEEVHQITIL